MYEEVFHFEKFGSLIRKSKQYLVVKVSGWASQKQAVKHKRQSKNTARHTRNGGEAERKKR